MYTLHTGCTIKGKAHYLSDDPDWYGSLLYHPSMDTINMSNGVRFSNVCEHAVYRLVEFINNYCDGDIGAVRLLE